MHSTLSMIGIFFLGMVVGGMLGVLWESINNDLNKNFMSEWERNKGGTNDAN